MTYGFCPENWPAFEHELRARGIAIGAIERVELRPDVAAVTIVTVTLRSGGVAMWSQEGAATSA